MGIIIGAGTTVTFRGSTGGGGGSCTGATSASWSYNPNVQRLYQLGSWTSCGELSSPTQTLNLTFYTPAPGGPYDVSANTTCTNSTITAAVYPGGCSTSSNQISGEWFVTGYSYSKTDARQPATESWSLMQYVGTNDEIPDYNIRGIAEGSITSSDSLPTAQSVTGIVLTGNVSQGYSGNISAGQIGREDIVYTGVVQTVGGGTSVAGQIGQGSVNIPYTPVWE